MSKKQKQKYLLRPNKLDNQYAQYRVTVNCAPCFAPLLDPLLYETSDKPVPRNYMNGEVCIEDCG